MTVQQNRDWAALGSFKSNLWVLILKKVVLSNQKNTGVSLVTGHKTILKFRVTKRLTGPFKCMAKYMFYRLSLKQPHWNVMKQHVIWTTKYFNNVCEINGTIMAVCPLVRGCSQIMSSFKGISTACPFVMQSHFLANPLPLL